MEMGGNTFDLGSSGYPYNSRRLNGEDEGQQYDEEPVGGAEDAYYPPMVWLVLLTFVYVRRTSRLLGRCFASEHKARRKKYTVAHGLRPVFGPVRALVVLFFMFLGWVFALQFGTIPGETLCSPGASPQPAGHASLNVGIANSTYA